MSFVTGLQDMAEVILRCYEELNEHLPQKKRKRDFTVPFEGERTVGDILLEEGVPHGEVDLVLVHGRSVDLEYLLQDGDRVSLYPVFERFDIGGLTKLKGRPLRVLRFVAEASLGRTAEGLRELGFDVLSKEASEAIETSRLEKRILLTSRAEVLSSGDVSQGIRIAEGKVEDQVKDIMERLHLNPPDGDRGAVSKTQACFEG